MSVGPVTNNGVTWDVIFNQLNGLGQTDAVEQLSDTNRSVTFTTNVNGTPTQLTVKIPDDLVLPSEVDPEEMDTLIDKLATANELTADQKDALKSEVTRIYSEAAKALSSVRLSASVSPGRVMFDLYQLMALLVEVGQTQRNAARDLRNTQNQQIQNSIQAQADAQRNAAIVGLAVGVTCGVITAAISMGMLMGQGAAYKTQVNAARASGMDAAQNKVNLLQEADTPEHAQAHLDKIMGSKDMPTGKALEEFKAKIDGADSVVKAKNGLDASKAAQELDVAKEKSATADAKVAEAEKAVESADGKVKEAKAAFDSAKADLDKYVKEHGGITLKENETPSEALARYEDHINKTDVGKASLRDEVLTAKLKNAAKAEDGLKTAQAEQAAQVKALGEAKVAQQTAAADLKAAQTKAETTAKAAGLEEGQKPKDLETAQREYDAARMQEVDRVLGGKDLEGIKSKIDGSESVVEAKRNFEAAKAAKELDAAKAKSETADAKLADTQKALDSAKDEYLSACGENVSASEDLKTYALEHGIPEERLAGTPREALARYESYIENSKVGDAAIPRDETLVAKFNKAIEAQDRVETASAEVETQTLALDEAKVAQQTAAADLKAAQTKAETTAKAAGLKENEPPKDFETARKEYRAALENEAESYADSYERAVATGAPKSEIAQARKEMVMARAYVNNELMRTPGLRTTPTEYKAAMVEAKGVARAASDSLNANLDYRGALHRIETLSGLNAINTAIGNVLQSMTQSISGAINSEATRMGAEQQKEQEQLDQTKDLFQQAQSLIDSVIQLMQAVRQAETQSMRDAIQA
jgi:hypothetical protein